MRNLLVLLVLASCATVPPPPTLAEVTAEQALLCEHKVPANECVKCHPELTENFKKLNDWCAEHAVPESQCLICHPAMTFEKLPPLPPGADLKHLSTMGEDVPSLQDGLAAGKVTVVDFSAHWCAPCKKIDLHVYGLLGTRTDLAYRKINIMDWTSPVAKRYLGGVPTLPYVIVFGKDGKEVRSISGLDLAALDAAIAEGAAR